LSYILLLKNTREIVHNTDVLQMSDEKALLLGLGFDNTDGHKRVTRGDNFYLAGGSEETHERMAETVVKFNEKLSRRGKHLHELSREEFNDMMHEASDR
jgi:hypothetical protein